MRRSTDAAAVRGWLVLSALAAALFLAPLPAGLVESVYSRGLFPVWQSWVTGVSNLVPFAALDVLLVSVPLLAVWRIWRLGRGVRTSGVLRAGWEGVRRLLRAAAVLTLVFLLMWGLNYRRVPLEDTVPPVEPTVAELEAVLMGAFSRGAHLRPASAENPPGFDELTRRLPESFNSALARLGRPPLRTPGVPKVSRILTPFFTAAGVDGMIDPYALEAIVHPDLLPFERPFVLAHEWAHLAGTGDEAEASAIGWVACMQGDADLAYSGTVFLILEIAGALPRDVWREASRHLDPGIRADLQALAERQARQRPRVQRTAFRVYDRYLRANRVEEGVASYSRALSLMLSPALRDMIEAPR